MTDAPNYHAPRKAVMLALLGFTLWVAGDASLKQAGSGQINIVQTAFIIAVFVALPKFLLTLARGKPGTLWPRNLGRESLRSFLLLICAGCNVIIFTTLPLATIYSAVFVIPLLISLLAAILLKERLAPLRATLIAIGFAGAIIAIAPWHHDNTGAHYPLKSYIALAAVIIAFSSAYLILRRSSQSEHTSCLIVFPMLFQIAALAVPCALNWQPMETGQLSWIILSGLLAGAGNLAIVTSYRYAKANVVAPLHYSQIVTGGIVGWIFWNEQPSLWLIAGSAVIIVSGIALARLQKDA